MVKKGEYLDYAIEMEKKTIDYNPAISLKENEIVAGTELSIILEMAKKIKELELKIEDLQEQINTLKEKK